MNLEKQKKIYLKLNLKRINFFEIQLKKSLKKSYISKHFKDINFFQDQAKKFKKQINNLILEIN